MEASPALGASPTADSAAQALGPPTGSAGSASLPGSPSRQGHCPTGVALTTHGGCTQLLTVLPHCFISARKVIGVNVTFQASSILMVYTCPATVTCPRGCFSPVWPLLVTSCLQLGLCSCRRSTSRTETISVCVPVRPPAWCPRRPAAHWCLPMEPLAGFGARPSQEAGWSRLGAWSLVSLSPELPAQSLWRAGPRKGPEFQWRLTQSRWPADVSYRWDAALNRLP